VADRQRFTAKVVPVPDGCAFWTGAIGEDGYGRFLVGRAPQAGTVSAHRWLWVHLHGPLPAGVLLRHCCDETSCVRLAHLLPGDHQHNMSDMRARGRQGGPWHRGRADTRGPAGRGRAIRAALHAGYHPDRLAAAIRAGDPARDQLQLFLEPGP